ncbi:MAG: ATP:cob(I)alamin adenosyltransferase [Bacteroidetes bacterium GWF2_43_63]|nr:MAG: ATP:cob(I)alamin adenosyltransferase [Bacteroidetes bacterium GWE2_42_42]OFY55841.1 MAG: ATP:cob(I)alamin adenosyltransferase [Bacteroidetes bacterium GWF2_43_63]HBG71238.1 cob(I)yrinic acid a,c-diamide adenosyltransferase [Bacteroidales bacterium]HCB60541.1 cob(I)yrinic acid a,c-diamide adenosyltransferase [Bacteroidales bacterium]HCY22502.1 cob(I)yrinic acid a,c-diamide adenosyltransferase [Bacteroidales bacterium]
MENKDNKIYTRKGDSGTTSLIGGKIVSKASIRVESYGMVDELNSFTGCLYEKAQDELVKTFLFQVMNKLFLIESHLAVDPAESCKRHFTEIVAADAEAIEKEIDRMNETLPELSNFILPAGSETAAAAHVCRTVCRRAERTILRLHETEPVQPEILKYINRLSDYFFVLARWISHSSGNGDVVWIAK